MTPVNRRPMADHTSSADPAPLFERLAAELGETQDAELAMRSVLRHGSALLEMPVGAAILLDERGALQEALCHGIPDRQAEAVRRACTSFALDSASTVSRPHRLWTDLGQEQQPDLAALAASGYRSCLALPLTRHGLNQGLLFFLSRVRREPGEEVLRWAGVMALQASLALDNSRLFEAALRQAVELGAFYETVTATAEGREAGPLLESVIEQAARLLESQGGIIFRANPRERVVRAIAQVRSESLAPVEGQCIPFGVGAAGIAAESMEPVLVDDYASWPHRLDGVSFDRSSPVRVLATPLIWRQQLLGVLEVWAGGTRRVFSDLDVRLARLVANQAANALGVASLVEAERQQRQMAQALQEASLAINRAIGLDEVLERILEQVMRAIPCDAANFRSYEQTQARVLRARGYEQFGLNEADVLKMSFSIEDHANYRRMAGGEAVVLGDTLADETWDVLRGLEWIRSWAGVPVRFGDEIVGFLNLDSATPNTFDQTTAERLTVFAAHAGIAMHNARLYQKLSEEHVKLLQVYEIGQRVSGSLVPDEIHLRLLEGVMNALGATFGGVYALRQHSDGRLRAAAVMTHGLGSEVENRHPLPQTLAEEVARLQAPQEVLVGYAESTYWVLGVPVFVGERLWGVTLVWVPWRQGDEPPPLGVLAAAVQQAGLALLNADQHGRVQRRLAEMMLLQQMAGAIARRLETDAVIATLTDSLHQKLGYPAVHVLMRHGDEMVLRALAGPQPVLDRLPYGRGIIGRVMRTGIPECVRDVRQDPDYVAGLVGTRAEMVVPIRVEGEIIGVINIESSDPSQVHQENLELLQVLADQVSVALQNAALYEQVRRNVEDLEARVQERTALLEEALEQAKSADRTKAQFVADVSHELRTPLTNIGLYLDLLEMGREDRRGEYISILRREIERLGALIEQLLAISEYDADQVELKKEPTDINTLIRVLVGDRARLIGGRSLQLVVEAAPDLPRVPADPQQLMRVMTNLLTNATNYTPPGGTITLETGQRTAEGKTWVSFSVADTGPGIPEDERPRVFDRFFRGIVGRASGLPGTGLGLAICKEIVERHGGQIVLASGGGKGTKVTVWLPAGRK
ncbi:MAG: GAF domain-containing protein [Chloroflexota bacterium]